MAAQHYTVSGSGQFGTLTRVPPLDLPLPVREI